ncbi:hypothetical protein B566_EDAN002553, partial [Ephemera danica]
MMGFTTICSIPLCFILCTALYVANAELILLHHKDTFYCVGSRETRGQYSNRTSFKDANSQSRWLPVTRNDELSHLNTLMSNYEHKKWEIGKEWVQCNNESITELDNNLNRTVYVCNEANCNLRTEFQSSQTFDLCIEILYSSTKFKGEVILHNKQTNDNQARILEKTSKNWKWSRFEHLTVSKSTNFTLSLEKIGKGFKIGEFRVCSGNEYHITSLKMETIPSQPICSIIPERKENITMKQINGTEKSIYPNCPVGTLGKSCELRCSEIIPGNKECNGVIVCSHAGYCSCLNGLSGSKCDQ